MSSYSKKTLKYIFTLTNSENTATSARRIEISGLRSSALIEKAGGTQFSTATCQIFGVPQEDMNEITTLQWNLAQLDRNLLEVFAIDEENNYETLVFQGDIICAWGVYQSMPDVFLYVEARNSFFNSMNYFAPTSYKGVINGALAIERIATQLGYHFENNQVNINLNNVYEAGSAIEQIQSMAKAMNIDLVFDDNSIVVLNKGQPRAGEAAIISKETGLITYPTFDSLGVDVTILFNPFIIYGGSIEIQSDLPRANGTFTVTSLTHYLESKTLDGQFFSQIRGTKSGFAITN